MHYQIVSMRALSQIEVIRKTSRFFLLTSLLLLSATAISAQVNSRQAPSESVTADKSSPDEQRSSGPIEDEMRAKRAIKYAESEHKENLDRAREVLELGTQLQTAYKFKHSLDRDDSKTLERLEKLTKQLRSKAGGSATDDKMDCPPTDLETAIKRVAETSESLSKEVKKTPRQVVSATVIDEANVLLQLIEIVRQFSR
jgi:membrane-associated HD superfamily phosphohydrolase